jgi:alpha-L-fucosidase
MTPYTEWYDNAIRVPESPSARHHAEHWGGRPYADFREPFLAGLEAWDPSGWARLFRRAGARYVVLVTKHHDGFCLWPSSVRNPHRENWTTERDVVGELAEAVRGEGLRFGVYYSGGIDWSFNPRPVRTLVQFIGSSPRRDYPAYAEAQVRELIERYRPSVLWNDICWPQGLAELLRLFADYYAAVPEGVVNDRWMHRSWALRLLSLGAVQRLADAWLGRRIRKDSAKGDYSPGVVPPSPVHYDFRTPEYMSFAKIDPRKWETTRGLTPSFGYNRGDREGDHEAPEQLVRSFADTISKNGNLLLNVGPRGEDAAIPEAQQSRLEALGHWLASDGDAVYDTRPAAAAEGETDAGFSVRFTHKADTWYAIAMGRPPAKWSLRLPPGLPAALRVTRVADGSEIAAHREGDRLWLESPPLAVDSVAPAFALRPASA